MAHEQIKYDGFGSRLTPMPCPNGVTLNSPEPIQVASVACRKCDHFVSRHFSDKIVTCSFIGDSCDKARDSAKDGPNV
jgi:hypothetical protein